MCSKYVLAKVDIARYGSKLIVNKLYCFDELMTFCWNVNCQIVSIHFFFNHFRIAFAFDGIASVFKWNDLEWQWSPPKLSLHNLSELKTNHVTPYCSVKMFIIRRKRNIFFGVTSVEQFVYMCRASTIYSCTCIRSNECVVLLFSPSSYCGSLTCSGFQLYLVCVTVNELIQASSKRMTTYVVGVLNFR